MKVTELKSEGLRKELKVVVSAAEMAKKAAARLQEVGKRAKVPGFRPGHIPLDVLKQRYGKSVEAELTEKVVTECSHKAVEEQKIRLAMQPKIENISYEEGKDLSFTMALDVFPDVKDIDFAKISLERATFEITDADVNEGIARIAEYNKMPKKVEAARKAQKGDVAVIDFKGSVDGIYFPGGEGKEYPLELGSNSFIPGFEGQVEGMKPGESRTITVEFPKNYQSTDLAGKEAKFEIVLHELRELVTPEANDEFAKRMGMENLEALKKAVREQMEKDFNGLVRDRLKKQLFDVLDEKCDFDTPAGMVEMEFNAIWSQSGHGHVHGEHCNHDHSHDEAEEAPDAETKAEYERLAKRRVRLGLFLAETGNRKKINITQDDVREAVLRQARSYPGQERQVIDFYQKNPRYIEELKGPIIEDKVVDFILGEVKYQDKKTTLEALRSEHNDADGDAPKEKKASGKKASAKSEEKKAAPKKKKAS